MTLSELDIRLFFLINHAHSPLMDEVMYYVSETWVWAPVALWLIFMIYRKFDARGLVVKERIRKTLMLILLAGASAGLANTITSEFLKPTVQRYRPCREESRLTSTVHIVHGHCGGKYGFASSHTANFFAVATFLAFVLRKRAIILFCFGAAALTAYSRVYLGVHYPGDVFTGAIIGIACSLLIYKLLQLKNLFPD